jgi:hypothetical protein
MRIDGGDAGYVGIGAMFPITRLHVNGDITFGSNLAHRKWRFITQDWLEHGKMFLLPDDANGAPDYKKAFTIDPIPGNFIFGKHDAVENVTIGNAYSDDLGFGAGYLGFNAQRQNGSDGWYSISDSANNGGGIIWGTIGGSIFMSPVMNLANIGSGDETNWYDDQTVWNRRTVEVKWNGELEMGQVKIGNTSITTPQHEDYRLSVDGKLVAKEIYVTNTGWADYVFDDNYQLMPLESLQDYIECNNHLPNVPTTEEVLKNGNNTGETDRILLEKIEELSLYIIHINEQLKELKIENEKLREASTK